ncbi:sensor histidine kinase [Arthrobacter monumenti]
MADGSGAPVKWAVKVFRHGVFMMIGALLAVPYVAFFIWGTQVAGAAGVHPMAAVVVFFLLFLLLAVPASLSVTRALERTAVRELLGVELPDPLPRGGHRHPRRVRLWNPRGWRVQAWRGGLWYLVHLSAGGLTLVAVAVAIPVIVTLTVLTLTGQTESTEQITNVLSPFVDSTTAILWSLGLSAGIVVFTVLTGIALPHWAQVMLGPSGAELRALEEHRARIAAKRNELARELHDSVGHALTVTTLQATAAQSLLRNDPDSAERAMQAVADTGRAALAELDHVIGMLRNPDGNDYPGREGAPDLRLLQPCLDRLSEQGLVIDRHFDPNLIGRLPGAVSAAAFKVVQEGLTNVLRYAQPQEAILQIDDVHGRLHLVLTNPVAVPRQVLGGGRGLDGLTEHARLVGGTAQSALHDGNWILRAEFPLEEERP